LQHRPAGCRSQPPMGNSLRVIRREDCAVWSFRQAPGSERPKRARLCRQPKSASGTRLLPRPSSWYSQAARRNACRRSIYPAVRASSGAYGVPCAGSAGRTKRYAQVAEAIGNAKAVRAVGGACAANPIPIFVPCHRVLAAKHGLGGFSGGLAWKRRLLAGETTTRGGAS
jgi:O-6-methylguanine DNA methyltransferase